MELVPSSPTFRPLRKEELPTVLSWAREEGWNPGLHDSDPFFAADPEGFHAMDYEGKLIGSASTVVYGGCIGFVGLFIVRPEWRGRGWGVAFWQHFIRGLKERIGPKGGAALDGVFAMQEKYALSGFRFSHRNLRMEGIGKASELHPLLVDASAVPFASLLEFDADHFGAKRADFLRLWLRPRDGKALVYSKDGQVHGYGVIRPCHRGYKIGPLFAEKPEIAEALFTGLSAQAIDAPLFLDIPENNPTAIELANRHSLTESFGCARMTLGNYPILPWQRIYGVTTFELG